MKKHETELGTTIELEDGDLPESAYTHRLAIGEKARGLGSRVDICIEEAAAEILGPHGRLLSMSKTAYQEEHPDHVYYPNACIFDGRRTSSWRRRKAKQIWFGDLDLTVDADRLQQLADQVGTIIVTPETPYRFKGLPRKPRRLEVSKRFTSFARSKAERFDAPGNRAGSRGQAARSSRA